MTETTYYLMPDISIEERAERIASRKCDCLSCVETERGTKCYCSDPGKVRCCAYCFALSHLKAALAAERNRCAKIASDFSNPSNPHRSLHPQIPWDQMKEDVKIAAHSTAQQIAILITMNKPYET